MEFPRCGYIAWTNMLTGISVVDVLLEINPPEVSAYRPCKTYQFCRSARPKPHFGTGLDLRMFHKQYGIDLKRHLVLFRLFVVGIEDPLQRECRMVF